MNLIKDSSIECWDVLEWKHTWQVIVLAQYLQDEDIHGPGRGAVVEVSYPRLKYAVGDLKHDIGDRAHAVVAQALEGLSIAQPSRPPQPGPEATQAPAHLYQTSKDPDVNQRVAHERADARATGDGQATTAVPNEDELREEPTALTRGNDAIDTAINSATRGTSRASAASYMTGAQCTRHTHSEVNGTNLQWCHTHQSVNGQCLHLHRPLGGNPSWLVTSTMIDPYPLSRYAQDMAGLEAGSSTQPLQSTASLTGFRCRTCAQLMEADWENGVRIARMRGTQIRHVSTAPTPGLSAITKAPRASEETATASFMREFTRLTGDGIEANMAAATAMTLVSGVAPVQPAASDTTAGVPITSTSESVRTSEAKQPGRTAHTAGLAERPSKRSNRESSLTAARNNAISETPVNWRNLREYIRSCEVGKHLDTSKLGELLLKANTREQNQALYNEIVRQSTGLWDVLTKDYELQAALKALRDACGSDDTRPAGKQEPVSTTAATTPAPAPAKTATQTRPNGTLTCTQQPANPRKRKDRASQDTGDGYDWIMRWEILAAGLAEKYARVQVAALNTRGTACRASAIVGILVAIGSMRCVRHEDGGDYNFQYQRQRGHHTPDGEYLRCESWPGFWSRRRVQFPVDPSPPRHSRTFWTSSRTLVQREGVTERDRTRATGLREGRVRLGLRQVPSRSPLGPQQDQTEHISVEVRLAVGHEGTWKKPLRDGGTEILESVAAVRRWRPSKVDSPLTFETWRSTELQRRGHTRYESGEEAGVERVALMLQGRRQGWSGYDKERAYMWNEMWGFKHNPSSQQATQRQRITVELPVRMAGLPLERPADWLGIQEIDRMHRDA